jgi:hypothetical protein
MGRRNAGTGAVAVEPGPDKRKGASSTAQGWPGCGVARLGTSGTAGFPEHKAPEQGAC